MQQVLSQQMAQLHQLQQSAASRTPQPAGPVPSLPAESSRGPKRAAPDEGGAARPPEVAGPLPVHAAQPAPSGGPPSELRPPPPGIDPSVGDWPCVCGNWNWARRSQCNKCQAPKGSGSRLMTAGVLAAAASGSLGGADGGAADGEKQLRRKQLLAAATPSDGSVVPLYLGNMSKPSHYQMSHHNAGPSAGVKAVPPTIDPSVGDWLCTCGNWNWAKRHECNMCRGSKEAANIGAKRTGAAGGFIEYDQSEGERRKMRALEAQQQVQARKAEKRKCEFCKRFSCIC
ncbi:hypothetical protein AB1Y20_000550 [Prymnesium parvum]|uniref:RanBP2-type domain-containing protein n=1 Tax=Prymnesium parvum TaxID=97485 RepID=A0AB34K8V6_PRYPA